MATPERHAIAEVILREIQTVTPITWGDALAATDALLARFEIADNAVSEDGRGGGIEPLRRRRFRLVPLAEGQS